MKKPNEIGLMIIGLILGFTAGTITTVFVLCADIKNNKMEKSYVGEKVNVMTESGLKEMRVHYRKQDLYTDVYYLSNAEYGTYDACGEDCSGYFKYPIMKEDLIQLLN